VYAFRVLGGVGIIFPSITKPVENLLDILDRTPHVLVDRHLPNITNSSGVAIRPHERPA
jgi:hypothetical protein